jgi:hypothetical protein
MKTNTFEIPTRVTPWHVVGVIIIIGAIVISIIEGASLRELSSSYNDVMAYFGGSSGFSGGVIALVVITINVIGWTIGLILVGIGEIIFHAKARNGYLMILAKVPDVTKYKITYTLAKEDDDETGSR